LLSADETDDGLALVLLLQERCIEGVAETVVEGEGVGDLPRVLTIQVIKVGLRLDGGAGSLTVGSGDAEQEGELSPVV
jgi:hypothetical protein